MGQSLSNCLFGTFKKKKNVIEKIIQESFEQDKTKEIKDVSDTTVKSSRSNIDKSCQFYELGNLLKRGSIGDSYECFANGTKFVAKIIILKYKDFLYDGIYYFKNQFLKIQNDNFLNYVNIIKDPSFNNRIWIMSEFFQGM